MIRPLTLVIAAVLTLTNLFAQDGGTDSTTTEIFLPVEQSAEFPGGMVKFYKYIGDKLKYPAVARKNKVSGKVFISIVINKDGSIDDDSIVILKGLHESCDNEAIRVMKECPDWIPATIKNEPVRQRFVIPLVFKL